MLNPKWHTAAATAGGGVAGCGYVPATALLGSPCGRGYDLIVRLWRLLQASTSTGPILPATSRLLVRRLPWAVFWLYCPHPARWVLAVGVVVAVRDRQRSRPPCGERCYHQGDRWRVQTLAPVSCMRRCCMILEQCPLPHILLYHAILFSVVFSAHF